jgi:hypothetical protein
MNTETGLPRKYEKPFRDALNHAGHMRVDELRTALRGMTDEQAGAGIQLCAFVSAYTVIDVVSRRWPTDSEIRQIADGTAEIAGSDTWPGVTGQNVYLWLSRCAFGFEDLAEVLGKEFKDTDDLLMAPFFLTIDVLATFLPKGQSIGGFLDVIEDAYEKAWQLDLNLLPALMVRSRMPRPEQGPGAGNSGK